MPTNTITERRFNRWSWLALGLALFNLLYMLGQAILSWQLPGDGWALNCDPCGASPRIYFMVNLNPGPTPLRAGDELLTVEGLTSREIAARQYKFFQVHAPDWTEGTVLHYTVRREGQEVALEVPQHLFSPWQPTAAQWRAAPGPTTVAFVSSSLFFIVGLVVFFLRPRNPAAHALLVLGVTFLFQIISSFRWVTTAFYPVPPASIPVDGWTFAINPSIMYMALAFPAPKLPVRRFPRLTVAVLYLSAPIALNAAYWLNLDNPEAYFKTATAVYIGQIALVFLVTLSSLIHSALTLRDPVGRTQLKWVALGLMSFIVPGIGAWLLGYLGFYSDWLYLLGVIGWFVFPICMAVAITRYRLFDIDIIIRRTLVYALLTASLALVYLGSVVVLQSLFRGLTGTGESELVIVLSTLAIAALFIPLRNRIQTTIDHRFYRRKYDAQQVLASFAVTARDETDLNKLTGHLVEVVDETMQPSSLSLWIGKTISRG